MEELNVRTTKDSSVEGRMKETVSGKKKKKGLLRKIIANHLSSWQK